MKVTAIEYRGICWALLLLLLTEVSHSARIKECTPGSRCKPYGDCTELHHLGSTRTRASIARFRSLICHTDEPDANFRTMVCCPSTIPIRESSPPKSTSRPTPPPSSSSRPTPPLSSSSRPTQCSKAIVSQCCPVHQGTHPWMAVLGFSPARGETVCTTGTRCVSFEDCTELHHLLIPPTQASITRLRNLTCGTLNTDTKVCCPRPQGTTTPAPNVTTASPGEDLLPTDCGKTVMANNIYGGTKAQLGEHPWMALLGFTRPGQPTPRWMCGGTLITERYVLTAAHCTDLALTGYRNLKVVRLGELDLETNPDCTGRHLHHPNCAPVVRDYGIESVKRHPQFNKRAGLSDDIALLRLNGRARYNLYVSPICLPPAGSTIESIMAGRNTVTVTGWGKTESGGRSMQLLQVDLPIVAHDVCRAASNYNTTMVKDGDGQVCFGGKSNEDSCFKDSGGPAIITNDMRGPPYVQIGIVSFGPMIRCGVNGVPGVYVDVTSYRQWIVDNIRP